MSTSAKRKSAAPLRKSRAGTASAATGQAAGSDAPRQKLIHAATKVFGRDGFQHASVREITELAGVNVAAVRYYFGNKLDLYREVVLSTHRDLLAQHPFPQPGNTPRESLRAWIKHLLEMILLPGRCRSRLGKIMVFEMIEPTRALNDVVKLVIRPFHTALTEQIGEILGPEVPPILADRLAHCVVSLCVVWDDHRAIIERLGSSVPSGPSEIEALSETLTTFVVGGLDAVRSTHTGSPTL